MNEQVGIYRGLLKELRRISGITVRDIESYSGMSSSTLYQNEKGNDPRISSCLELLTLYLSACGQAFRHQVLVSSLEEAVRNGWNLRLVAEPGDCSGAAAQEGMLLEKRSSGEV